MNLVERAYELRRYIEKASVSLDDADALDAVELFPAWKAVTDYAAGDRVRSNGILYRCRQAHTSQPGWEPENVPAMWAAINVTHAGTLEDPIPAVAGMEYTYGLHYLDPEDGKTYLCRRTGEPEGGKIVLLFLPHELVGQYFEAVT